MMRPTSPYYYENIIGGKTGFHDQALNTLVTYAGKDDVTLISVVMKDNGAALAYSDTKTLMEYGFTLYEDKTLLTTSDFSTTLPVEQNIGTDKNGEPEIIELGDVTIVPESDFSEKVPSVINTDSLELKPNLDATLSAPVEVGTKVGTLDIYYNDYMLGSVNLVASTGRDAMPQSEIDKMHRLEYIKEFTTKALKILAAVIVALVVIVLAIRLFFLIRNRNKKRRKQIYSYGSRRKQATAKKPKKKKIKYKLKFK
jgi:D-alanyl-D-alanine carboxypeptidase